MDILRTEVGKQFCRHLNTRGKRKARRALMQQYRWVKSSIHGDLLKKFGGRILKEISPADITQCVRDTAKRLACPDPADLVIEQDEGRNLIVSGPPEAIARLAELKAQLAGSQQD